MLRRGPDEQSAVFFPAAHSALGAARLSLVDVAHGGQPVSNEDGAVWAVLNGEIYNYRELRKRLQAHGHRFRSESDTEVLVHLYEQYGEAMFAELYGMFALAIFDLRERRFLLARDHAGMKPLYFAEQGSGFAFASDARALFAGGLVHPEADWEQIEHYFDFGYVPAPGCAFRDMQKLPPGCLLRWKGGESSVQRYWHAPVECDAVDPDAPSRLEALLQQATRSHLQGDVEVGCFLSGGWDSSIIAAMAREHVASLKTFSLVLPESPKANEATHARAVASALETDHYEVEYRATMLPRLMEESVWKLEEPSSCTPNVLLGLLSQLAAKHVKAVVGGEGSDELFAGYEWLRPQIAYRLQPWVPSWIPRLLMPLAPDLRWRRGLRQLAASSPDDIDFEYVRRSHPDDILSPRLLKRGDTTGSDLYTMVSRQLGSESVSATKNRLQKRLLLEFGGRLTGGILFANDRMSMAESLEVRTPFLDRHVVEFAMRQPAGWKLRGAQEKAILRPLAEKYAPVVAGRRKLGLHVPEADYRHPDLKEFSRSVLLDGNSLFPRPEMEQLLRRWYERKPRDLRFLQIMLRVQLWWNSFLAPGSRGRMLATDLSLPVSRVAWKVQN